MGKQRPRALQPLQWWHVAFGGKRKPSSVSWPYVIGQVTYPLRATVLSPDEEWWSCRIVLIPVAWFIALACLIVRGSIHFRAVSQTSFIEELEFLKFGKCETGGRLYMMPTVFRIFKHTKVENTWKPPEVSLCSLYRERHIFAVFTWEGEHASRKNSSELTQAP